MSRYIIQFIGSCEVNATTAEEAEETFWNAVNDDKALPSNLFEIVNIEED